MIWMRSWHVLPVVSVGPLILGRGHNKKRTRSRQSHFTQTLYWSGSAAHWVAPPFAAVAVSELIIPFNLAEPVYKSAWWVYWETERWCRLINIFNKNYWFSNHCGAQRYNISSVQYCKWCRNHTAVDDVCFCFFSVWNNWKKKVHTMKVKSGCRKKSTFFFSLSLECKTFAHISC